MFVLLIAVAVAQTTSGGISGQAVVDRVKSLLHGFGVPEPVRLDGLSSYSGRAGYRVESESIRRKEAILRRAPRLTRWHDTFVARPRAGFCGAYKDDTRYIHKLCFAGRRVVTRNRNHRIDTPRTINSG